MPDTAIAVTEDKHAGGRPSKYQSTLCRVVEKFCLLHKDALDTDIARFLDVAPSTVALWKDEHQEFSDAIKKGKEGADVQIASTLFKKANGYFMEEEVLMKSKDGEYVREKIKKYYPPDTTAAIFWLKNRQSDQWRDRKEIQANINITLQAVLEESLPKMVDITPEVVEEQRLSDVIEDK